MGWKGFCVAVSVLLCSSNISANELPNPPEGFTWFVSENKVGTFLRPDGWYVKEEGEKSDKAVFITVEDIDKVGQFTTGLSINMVPRVSERTGIAAKDYAKAFVSKYLTEPNQFKILRTYSVPEQDSYEGYGLRYRGDNKGVNTIANVLAIASNRDDILYIFVFEAPGTGWDEAWKKGRLMLNMFGLGE